jgi:hypothetical protein
MNARSRRQAARIGTQAAELLVAAPQVVAHRLGRMALSGPRPSVNDRREFHRMGAEKVAAFGEAARGGAARRPEAAAAAARPRRVAGGRARRAEPGHPSGSPSRGVECQAAEAPEAGRHALSAAAARCPRRRAQVEAAPRRHSGAVRR